MKSPFIHARKPSSLGFCTCLLALMLATHASAELPYFDKKPSDRTGFPQFALGVVDFFGGVVALSHNDGKMKQADEHAGQVTRAKASLAQKLADREADSRFTRMRGLEDAIAVLEGTVGCENLLAVRATELAELHTSPLANGEKSLDEWHRIIEKASEDVRDFVALERSTRQLGLTFLAVGTYLFLEIPGRLYIWQVEDKDPGLLPLLQLPYRAAVKPVLRRMGFFEIFEVESID